MSSPGGRRSTVGNRRPATAKKVEVDMQPNGTNGADVVVEKDPQVIAKEEELEQVVNEFKALDFPNLRKELVVKLDGEIQTLEKN